MSATPGSVGRTVVIAAVLLVAALGAARVGRFASDPGVRFLRGESGAAWIGPDEPVDLTAHPIQTVSNRFRFGFQLAAPVTDATLTVRALTSCAVFLDGRPLPGSETDRADWKRPRRFESIALAPGAHEIVVEVRSDAPPTAVLVHGEALGLVSGAGWTASPDGERWSPVRLLARSRSAPVSYQFPGALRALASVLPWLAPVFVLVFAWTWLVARRPRRIAGIDWQVSHLRWVLLAAWAVLAVNNIGKLPVYLGFDVEEHVNYVRFIAEGRGLPLATDGWQMFQAPLYYLISAPLYAGLSRALSETALLQALRVIPLACGLAQVEIAYRTARLVFPGRRDCQIVVLLTGSLMPMSLYMSQVVGNEPLAAALTSLTILLALSLAVGRGGLGEQPTRRFVLIGLAWGLALLSKATAVLAAPLLGAAVLAYGRRAERPLRESLLRGLVILETAAVVCGWYYIRNWVLLGRPVVDSSSNITWSQYPGYRTPLDFLTFGESLVRPIFSTVHGIWDGLYSTVWLDGTLSGVTLFEFRPPWNDSFLIAGSLLALVPTLLMLAGCVTAWRGPDRASRLAARLALAGVGVYLAAILDLYVRLPMYSVAKGSYMLGLLPCFAILVAAGYERLRRWRALQAGLVAWMVCWALAAFAAYFAGSV